MTLNAALEWAKNNQQQILNELKEFVAIPSVSNLPKGDEAIQRAAEWVAGQLSSLGSQNVQIMPTARHPVVYGELPCAGPNKPTVLLYGHYDVQPPEPLELWDSPAYAAVIRGEHMFGRGSSDMKGQVVLSLKAIEALVRHGGCPVNFKFIFEGEEEIGSPSLDPFLEQHKDLLKADFVVNPDTGMISAEDPSITYGLRGLSYVEITLYGPDHDLHSGLFGGVVHNPANVLCQLIAGMHDSQGRVTLPGFYDKVRTLTPEERAELARLPLGDDYYLKGSGAPALYGEAGYTSVERAGARPTLDVNGLLSGYTGEGSKTVLPAKAMAKISTRLVPDQDPEEVIEMFRRYLEANVPPTLRWELKKHGSGSPSLTDIHLPGVQALSVALEETWGKPAVYRREGGSVPVTASIEKILGIPSVLTGFGLPEDNIHAPNEKIHLPTFFRGLEAFIRFFHKLGQ